MADIFNFTFSARDQIFFQLYADNQRFVRYAGCIINARPSLRL
jgi:hypothetical protein